MRKLSTIVFDINSFIRVVGLYRHTMKKFLSHYRYPLLLIVIGLSLLGAFDYLTQISSQGILYPDSFSYVESAKNLYIFHRGHNYRPLLMALLNGIPYVFGASDATIVSFSLYVNVLCWLGFHLVLFKMLSDFVTPKRAFYLTLLSLLIIGNLAYVFHLLTENIFMFLCIGGFYQLQLYDKNKQFSILAKALTIFLLCVLIKPGSLFLALALCIYFGKTLWNNWRSKAMGFVYGSLSLLLVQCAGIKYQFGDFTISYIDSVTYYNYLGSKAKCLEAGKEYEQMNNPRAEYIFSYPCHQQKQIASADLKDQLLHNTSYLMRAYVLDILENTKTGNTCIADCQNKAQRPSSMFWRDFLYDITKWQNRLGTLLAFGLIMFYGLKRLAQREVYLLMAFFIAYIIGTSGISCGQGDRFHVITLPFVVLLCAKLYSERKPKTKTS